MCSSRSGFKSRRRRELIVLGEDAWLSNFSFSTSDERLLSVLQSGVSARFATLGKNGVVWRGLSESGKRDGDKEVSCAPIPSGFYENARTGEMEGASTLTAELQNERGGGLKSSVAVG